MKKYIIFNLLLAAVSLTVFFTPREKLEEINIAVKESAVKLYNKYQSKEKSSQQGETLTFQGKKNEHSITTFYNKDSGEYSVEFPAGWAYRRDSENKFVFYNKSNSNTPETEYANNLGFFFMKEKHRHSVEVNGDAVIIQRVFSAKDGDPGSGMAVGSNWKQLYKKEDIINGEVYQEFRYLKTNE